MSYEPDYCSHPGRTLVEKLIEIKFPINKSYKRCGMKSLTMWDIIIGFQLYNDDEAQCLAKATGISGDFWIKRRDRYVMRMATNRTKEGDKC